MSTVVQNEDDDYDIDVAVVFDKSDLEDKGAKATRNMVANALKRKTRQINAEPEVKTSCVRVKYADGYHIDFAIYRRTYDEWNDCYVYEHAGSDWTARELKGLSKWFTAQNDNSDGKLRKVVRLSKMFCKSSQSWKNMPSGLLQIVLCDEKLQKDTHNKHLPVLDYKKQERAKEVAALEEEIEGAQVVLELKEEKIDSLEKEIESKCVGFRKEQSEAQKKLDATIAENQKLQSETTELRLKNSELRLEYYENVDKLTDKQKEIEAAQKEADKWMMISDTVKWQTEKAQLELEEAERLKKELLGAVDGDDYLKEQVIELRYQNQILREENRSLKDKLEKAYEFMKQFVIGGINLLEKFMEWLGEKVKDVGRGRQK